MKSSLVTRLAKLEGGRPDAELAEVERLCAIEFAALDPFVRWVCGGVWSVADPRERLRQIRELASWKYWERPDAEDSIEKEMEAILAAQRQAAAAPPPPDPADDESREREELERRLAQLRQELGESGGEHG
jgi:hypothetical protein